MKFRVGVTGSRDYQSRWRIDAVLYDLFKEHKNEVLLKVGDCPTGVDCFATEWHTMFLGEEPIIFDADWEKHGKAAGPLRNEEMVDSGLDLLLAWPRDHSKGTRHCAVYAASKGVEVQFPDLPRWARWAAPIARYE